MTRIQALRWMQEQLRSAGVADAEQEAAHTLSSLLECEIGELYLKANEQISGRVQEKLVGIARERGTGVPLAYLLGERYFMGFRFAVTPDVLIPRQDTELLCETALELISHNALHTALDLCTGSGCIAIALAKLSDVSMDALDISRAALAVARENARKLGADVHFFQSDLWDKVEGHYDLITANPPYIKESEYRTLMREVREHEPRQALFAMEEGLYYYHKIVPKAADYLNDNGYLVLEIGYDQRQAVEMLMSEAGFQNVRTLKDYGGYDRVVVGQRPVKIEV